MPVVELTGGPQVSNYSISVRSSAISVVFIARQFGVPVNADAVEEAIKSGALASTKGFANYFFKQGVLARLGKLAFRDLLTKKYIFPCVSIMKDAGYFLWPRQASQPNRHVGRLGDPYR